ncbi:DUF397 domain-containing protein [Streptomyces sp. SBST2-5]|uniref:DUF397 domain-containing protein n=1 Tax=Streptomyces composti TaxID=2720025 RepID=A0ABX1AAR8_9ACTN|nr:DUF397 domain-containing protein [Streptomyces composti]NJP51626.1 DUF397 domain-containing protein [Streptomyces composti]
MRECDLSNAHWRKSTCSDGNEGECVEVAGGVAGVAPVRDGKVTDGPVIVVGSAAWTEFIRTVGATGGATQPR